MRTIYQSPFFFFFFINEAQSLEGKAIAFIENACRGGLNKEMDQKPRLGLDRGLGQIGD